MQTQEIASYGQNICKYCAANSQIWTLYTKPADLAYYNGSQTYTTYVAHAYNIIAMYSTCLHTYLPLCG